MRRLDPEGGSAVCSSPLATAAPVSACPSLWEGQYLVWYSWCQRLKSL